MKAMLPGILKFMGSMGRALQEECLENSILLSGSWRQYFLISKVIPFEIKYFMRTPTCAFTIFQIKWAFEKFAHNIMLENTWIT